jgi:hypothetical protein
METRLEWEFLGSNGHAVFVIVNQDVVAADEAGGPFGERAGGMVCYGRKSCRAGVFCEKHP